MRGRRLREHRRGNSVKWLSTRARWEAGWWTTSKCRRTATRRSAASTARHGRYLQLRRCFYECILLRHMATTETQQCGFRIHARPKPNQILAPDEYAVTTYGVLPSGFVLTAPVIVTAYWGPGDKIPPLVAGAGRLAAKLIGGVIFKNC